MHDVLHRCILPAIATMTYLLPLPGGSALFHQPGTLPFRGHPIGALEVKVTLPVQVEFGVGTQEGLNILVAGICHLWAGIIGDKDLAGLVHHIAVKPYPAGGPIT